MFNPSLKSYVIASPLEGVLRKEGKPLPNTKIIRTLKWNGNEEGFITEHYTDNHGIFSLPSHEEELALGILDQFVAKMALDVEMDGEVYELWYSNKLRPEVYEETGGEVTGFICDLANDELAVPTSPTAILTRCRWNNMPE